MNKTSSRRPATPADIQEGRIVYKSMSPKAVAWRIARAWDQQQPLGWVRFGTVVKASGTATVGTCGWAASQLYVEDES